MPMLIPAYSLPAESLVEPLKYDVHAGVDKFSPSNQGSESTVSIQEAAVQTPQVFSRAAYHVNASYYASAITDPSLTHSSSATPLAWKVVAVSLTALVAVAVLAGTTWSYRRFKSYRSAVEQNRAYTEQQLNHKPSKPAFKSERRQKVPETMVLPPIDDKGVEQLKPVGNSFTRGHDNRLSTHSLSTYVQDHIRMLTASNNGDQPAESNSECDPPKRDSFEVIPLSPVYESFRFSWAKTVQD